jgi:3-phosphoshikimate 1-carboxyvinyltransferase
VIRISPPEKLDASPILPGSKSLSNRVLVISSFCEKEIHAQNLSASEDTVNLERNLKTGHSLIDVGPAGTNFRFLTAALASKSGNWTLTGNARIRERPIAPLVDALRTLGADIIYTHQKERAPIQIKGKPLRGGRVSVDATLSSQFTSALMLAGPLMERGLEISLSGEVASRPYILMTAEVMRFFGAGVEGECTRTIRIIPGNYKARDITIESDWSAATYWFEIIALCRKGIIQLSGLTPKSLQGDQLSREIFSRLGVRSEFKNDLLELSPSPQSVSFFEQDCREIPDLAPALAATCAGLNIPFRLTGLHTLALKESDRIRALAEELSKIGAVTNAGPDNLYVHEYRPRQNLSLVLESHDDHRIAMSLAPLSIALGAVVIDEPEVVGKSYPDYWKELQKAGFAIFNNS